MLNSALRKVVVVLALAMVPLAFTCVRAEPIPINFTVLDDPGEGFNDPVLGPAKQAAFRYAADL